MGATNPIVTAESARNNSLSPELIFNSILQCIKDDSEYGRCSTVFYADCLAEETKPCLKKNLEDLGFTVTVVDEKRDRIFKDVSVPETRTIFLISWTQLPNCLKDESKNLKQQLREVCEKPDALFDAIVDSLNEAARYGACVLPYRATNICRSGLQYIVKKLEDAGIKVNLLLPASATDNPDFSDVEFILKW